MHRENEPVEEEFKEVRVEVKKEMIFTIPMNTASNADVRQSIKGLVLTYVDDILVTTTEELGDATMNEIDSTWKCSEKETVEEGQTGVSFCGLVIEKLPDGYFIHQKL